MQASKLTIRKIWYLHMIWRSYQDGLLTIVFFIFRRRKSGICFEQLAKITIIFYADYEFIFSVEYVVESATIDA